MEMVVYWCPSLTLKMLESNAEGEEEAWHYYDSFSFSISQSFTLSQQATAALATLLNKLPI